MIPSELAEELEAFAAGTSEVHSRVFTVHPDNVPLLAAALRGMEAQMAVEDAYDAYHAARAESGAGSSDGGIAVGRRRKAFARAVNFAKRDRAARATLYRAERAKVAT